MSITTINETCGCGATFNVTARYANEAGNRVSEWRREHKHAESVGICGDMPPFMLGSPAQFPVCELKFGHVGAHSGDGEHWWHIDNSQPPATRTDDADPLASKASNDDEGAA